MEPPPSTESIEIRATNAATGLVIALSVGLIFLGVLAILMPAVASVAFTSAIGWIALVGGVFQVVQSSQSRAFKGQGLSLGVGILYAIAGLYILFNPDKATALLALALGLLFMAEGVLTIAMAFSHRAGGSMSWFVAINGIVTLILGILAINRWPFNALWLIGLYMGISLLLSGSSLLGAALALRKERA
ncbi:DUF308 domain-containing protein [Nodosilinea sp. LEGE 06152]|uniref:HdeD family acid-resistance protein n=1 Tax=Nodosilinea sp. LEGE 06152 TaxID=2777966 RepID=UPI0018805EB3|nr:DUF308 domain-containing protein [Nodosilinea sp. LEGE 06152]MBE9155413.1 DUF308 domain-containing protein [Nodosilinea sp. LEGE 06152]